MALSAVSDFLLQTVGEFALQVAGYITGRIVVPMLTLDRVHIEPSPKGEWTTPKWHGFNRQPNGSYLASAETGALRGLAFWIVVAIAYVVYRKAT